MGDLKTLSKAKMELEELYSGIPDDSVNLTFQYLVDVKQQNHPPEKMKKSTSMAPIHEVPKTPKRQPSPPLTKLPSLDFNTALQASNNTSTTHHRHHLHHHVTHELGYSSPFDSDHRHHHHHRHQLNGMHGISRHQHHQYGHSNIISDQSHQGRAAFGRADDDMSVISSASARGGRARRPGIPHSNICTVCSTYIYVFRHRCLVCGRVYCGNCVSIGMGGMTEGRKCIECLGRRFSQRYIQKAGKVGCCSTYLSSARQAELKWAEKGPRRGGERACGHSTMMSRSRSPVAPRTPTRAYHSSSNPPSFVTSSPYSPYTPNHHHLPL